MDALVNLLTALNNMYLHVTDERWIDLTWRDLRINFYLICLHETAGFALRNAMIKNWND